MSSKNVTCKSRIETNDVTVVAEYGDRDHSDKVSNVATVVAVFYNDQCCAYVVAC